MTWSGWGSAIGGKLNAVGGKWQTLLLEKTWSTGQKTLDFTTVFQSIREIFLSQHPVAKHREISGGGESHFCHDVIL